MILMGEQFLPTNPINQALQERFGRRRFAPSVEWVFIFTVCVQIQATELAEPNFKYFRADAGLATGTGPLPERLDAPDALQWRAALDSGHSTPILVNNRIFLTAYRPESKELAVLALDQASGQLLWRKSINPERIEQTHQIGNPA